MLFERMLLRSPFIGGLLQKLLNVEAGKGAAVGEYGAVALAQELMHASLEQHLGDLIRNWFGQDYIQASSDAALTMNPQQIAKAIEDRDLEGEINGYTSLQAMFTWNGEKDKNFGSRLKQLYNDYHGITDT
jgi:hypothetical protein